MPVLSSLVINDVEFILETIPDGSEIKVTKELVKDGEPYFHIVVEDEELAVDLERKIKNLYSDDDDFNYTEIYDENEDYK